ncbi:histidine kinase [Paenibacillus sp. HB172176]|uniref:sensor histidine kinase n=1 Tax=Paenibacillus sp. HB172176 TaxID=2493690 RepID=UPI00143931FE|nr:histidine kinase [Paenibacillus sp. HB172176]
MRFAKLFENRTIFPKLVSTFLLAIVPIYLIGFMINQIGATIIRKEIMSSIDTRTHYYLTSFETEIQRIVTLQRQYMIDADIQRLSTTAQVLSTYDKMVMEQSIQSKLQIMNNSSPFIEDARLYVPLIGKTIFPFTDEAGFLDMDADELGELIRKQASPIIYYKDRLTVNVVFPDPSLLQSDTAYVLQVELDQQALRRFLVQMTDSAKENAVLLSDNSSWVIDATAENSQMDDSIRALLSQATHQTQTIGQEKIKIGSEEYWVYYQHSPNLDANLVVYVSEKQIMGSLHGYRNWLVWLSAISMLVVLLFSFWIYRLIRQPLRTMVAAFSQVERGDMNVSIHHHHNDEFQYLYRQFNSMIEHLKLSITEVYETRIRAQRSELKQLQSQINPHFLYNTYFMVHRMAGDHDFDNVTKATQYLGEYFMNITRNMQDECTLEMEWKHMTAYIEIQTLRFSPRIDTRVDKLPDDYSDLLVPRLLLQPIVENAFEHGLKNKMYEGHIYISLQRRENQVIIAVEDNGDEFTDEKRNDLEELLQAADDHFETTGLINVHRRLQIKFGEQSGLRLSRGSKNGLRVELLLPAERKESGNVSNHGGG